MCFAVEVRIMRSGCLLLDSEWRVVVARGHLTREELEDALEDGMERRVVRRLESVRDVLERQRVSRCGADLPLQHLHHAGDALRSEIKDHTQREERGHETGQGSELWIIPVRCRARPMVVQTVSKPRLCTNL